ncbi:MAG: serine acetyltransferase [Phycisphaerales bacterium]|nr:serine acetyltransferase [Phycisphaerales bacterium]
MTSKRHPTIAQSRSVKSIARALARGAPREMRQNRMFPDHDAVAWTALNLHRVIFGICDPLGEPTDVTLQSIFEILGAEIAAAHSTEAKDAATAKSHADKKLRALMKALPKIQRALIIDLESAFNRDPAARTRAEIVLCYPGLRALCVHRIAHELDRLGVPLIPRMLAESAHDSTGIDIHPSAKIGSGFFVDHGTSVVIGETAVIGKNCTLYQGVTLGARRFDRHADGSLRRGVKRHPTLCDNVTVYANATILGGDTIIGKGSTIAAGALVQESVPAHSLVKPARVELTVAPSKKQSHSGK